MSTSSIGLSDQLHQYLLSVSSPPDPLWQRLNDETHAAVGYNMQISREQAQFMTVLIQLMGAGKAIEIGTFTGYSALTIARALPENGQLVACDVSAEWTSIAQRYWREAKVEEKIELKIAPALDTITTSDAWRCCVRAAWSALIIRCGEGLSLTHRKMMKTRWR